MEARCDERPANLDAMLVRPDGYIAWVGGSDGHASVSEKTLRSALEQWFEAGSCAYVSIVRATGGCPIQAVFWLEWGSSHAACTHHHRRAPH